MQAGYYTSIKGIEINLQISQGKCDIACSSDRGAFKLSTCIIQILVQCNIGDVSMIKVIYKQPITFYGEKLFQYSARQVTYFLTFLSSYQIPTDKNSHVTTSQYIRISEIMSKPLFCSQMQPRCSADRVKGEILIESVIVYILIFIARNKH